MTKIKLRLPLTFRFRRIRSRFLAAMILWSLPAIALLGITSYNISKSTVTELNAKSNQERLRTSSDIADLLFRNINGLHFSIVVSDAIRRDLTAAAAPLYLSSDKPSGDTSALLSRIISDSSADTKYVTSICLLDLQLRIACSGRSDDAGAYEGPNRDEQLRQSDWYRSAFEGKGKVLYYPSDIFGESDSSFSTIKLFRDKEGVEGEPLGLLVVNVSKSIFKTVFGEGEAYGGFMILDERQGLSRAVYGHFEHLPQSGGIDEVVNDLEEQSILVTAYFNQTTNWTFLHLVRSSELLGPSRNIPWITTAVAIAFAAIALVMSYLLSRTVTKPLLELKKMMLDWTKGARDFPVAFGNDEVGVIGETFKRISSLNEELSAKLIRSQLKEREAELRALQSQIKPHFLYNTLDSIYWMAILDEHKPIADIAESLSVSFKLILNQGNEMLTVRDELLHIRHYVRIQNIRFDNRFLYIEEVDESIMDSTMLKLLLQPLVENAIFHGLERKIGDGTIVLKGARDGGKLIFTISDDGVGMADISMTERGYGLRNVKERLNLYYGEQSDLEIWSQPGRGTKITIRYDPSP
ncbi:sensor histidine kinase [Cohnella sp.]|uniref:sensor histidine kinase n=1 Tax=Cohnella sp. TaxID=1883426 RepID=UPI0035615E12